MLRELRASAKRAGEQGRMRASTHLLVLRRTAERARASDHAKRTRELERLTLALAAHDPQRTLARGYALVEDRGGEPLGSAVAAREAGDLRLRFHDGTLPARVASDGEGP
jgi:exodeoxyribonuclease VII large subunit